MKKGILLLLLVSSFFAQGQSLKEALYGGKLKNQPGTVIRKGDDLTPKVDTTQKAVVDSAKARPDSLDTDSAAARPALSSDSAVVNALDKKDSSTVVSDSATAGAITDNATEKIKAPKDNNAVWKAYVDSVATTLKAEVLSSKKVKRGTYYATVSYTIGTDGQVEITDVMLSPENGHLQQQIKDRLAVEAPRLHPVLSSTGAPRKVNRKYNFTLTKE